MPPLRLARLRLLLLLVVLPGMAWAEDRWALVIGVSTYESDTIPSLRNTVNDARTVAAALDNMGFEVYYLENAARDEVEATVRDIAEEQGAAELGLVYFAGHGLQVEGQNYLLPSDVRAEGDDFLRTGAVSVGRRSAGGRDARRLPRRGGSHRSDGGADGGTPLPPALRGRGARPRQLRAHDALARRIP
jgi:hypothetical protein